MIDTCLISELRRPVPSESVKNCFQTCEENQLFISVLTIGEIKYRMQRLQSGKKKDDLEEWFNQVIDSFSNRILPITQHICITWAIMRSTAENKGRLQLGFDGISLELCLESKFYSFPYKALLFSKYSAGLTPISFLNTLLKYLGSYPTKAEISVMLS